MGAEQVEVWLAHEWSSAAVVYAGHDTEGRPAFWVHPVAGSLLEVVVSSDRLRDVNVASQASAVAATYADRPIDTDDRALDEYLEHVVEETCMCEPMWPGLEALLEGRWVTVRGTPLDGQGPVSALVYAYCASCRARHPGGWRLIPSSGDDGS
jgi:hypothetical protein